MKVFFEFILHDDDGRSWAEWDVYWNEKDEAGRFSSGTSPSLHAAIDQAVNDWEEAVAD
jgi:hypothetical protein